MSVRPALIAQRPPNTLPTGLDEDTFQQIVIAFAMRHGWRVTHIPPATRHGRIVTPYEGHPGLTDLILARLGIVLLAELKTNTGRVTREQLAWLDAAGPNGRLWRPSDWTAIRNELSA